MRAGPVWSPILNDHFPTLIVLGDYYIFGESDDGMDVNRLVREYAVNSHDQLDDFLMQHPDKMGHYMDLDLRYLPVGSAAALRNVLPMLEASAKASGDRVILASDLTPGMLKSNNIVYVGYFSGMGVLRDVGVLRLALLASATPMTRSSIAKHQPRLREPGRRAGRRRRASITTTAISPPSGARTATASSSSPAPATWP